jgi:hypothetical protein
MSHAPTPYEPFELHGDELRAAVVRYASNPIYLDNEEWVNDDNPYRRQLRPQVLKFLDFDRSLRRNEILNYESLAAQRLLTSIYEADLMFLPKSGLADKWDDFTAFYSPSTGRSAR